MLARVVLGCLTVGFVALQSCTAVLGMERATLESTDASVVRLQSTSPCTEPPTPDCAGCLEQNCGTDYASCLGDFQCRRKLDDYAICLGEECHGTSQACLSKLDSSLQACASGCSAKCSGTSLAALCDRYCGCMEEYCDGVIPGVLVGAACRDKCATDSQQPQLVQCLRNHCEGGQGATDHCRHATGEDPQCLNGILSPEPKPDPSVCLGRAERGWFCKSGDDCCSRECVGTGACK